MHYTCISEHNTDLFDMTKTELHAVIIEQNLKRKIQSMMIVVAKKHFQIFCISDSVRKKIVLIFGLRKAGVK